MVVAVVLSSPFLGCGIQAERNILTKWLHKNYFDEFRVPLQCGIWKI